MDWLLADVERASGTRLRALVPALAEHVGCAPLAGESVPLSLLTQRHSCRDQSSLAGVRREWQRSAYFKHVPFKGAGEPTRRHSPPPWTAVVTRRSGSDVLSDTGDSPPAPPYDGDAAPWRTGADG